MKYNKIMPKKHVVGTILWHNISFGKLLYWDKNNENILLRACREEAKVVISLDILHDYES